MTRDLQSRPHAARLAHAQAGPDLLEALVTGVVAFGTCQWLLPQGLPVEAARNGTPLLTVLLENVQAFNSRSETLSVFRHNPRRNRLLQFGTLMRLWPDGFLFPSRVHPLPQLTSHQCAQLVNRRVVMVGLRPADHGTHSLRRTKATSIYRRTKNLRAVQLPLGHRTVEGTVRDLGVEVEDALALTTRPSASDSPSDRRTLTPFAERAWRRHTQRQRRLSDEA